MDSKTNVFCSHPFLVPGIEMPGCKGNVLSGHGDVGLVIPVFVNNWILIEIQGRYCYIIGIFCPERTFCLQPGISMPGYRSNEIFPVL
jgi:hypothetical protein